jgi:hypothetical protein
VHYAFSCAVDTTRTQPSDDELLFTIANGKGRRTSDKRLTLWLTTVHLTTVWKINSRTNISFTSCGEPVSLPSSPDSTQKGFPLHQSPRQHQADIQHRCQGLRLAPPTRGVGIFTFYLPILQKQNPFCEKV